MKMNKKTIITIVIVVIVIGVIIYLVKGKDSPELEYAKNVLGLAEDKAKKVVEFAKTQILNRADGEDGWRESTAQKALDRGVTLEQQALKEALYHLQKHNKL